MLKIQKVDSYDERGGRGGGAGAYIAAVGMNLPAHTATVTRNSR